MRVNVYVPLVFSAVLAALVPLVAARLRPSVAARALAALAVVATGTWYGSLTLLASTAVARTPLGSWAGHWTVAALRRADPVHDLVALGSAGVLTVSLLRLGHAAWRQGRALHWAGRENAALPPLPPLPPGSGDLVVVDDAAPLAFALPGRRRRGQRVPGRVVVSPAMLRVLDAPGQRDALLAHERAHLRHRHHWYQTLWQLTAAAVPLLRRLPETGGFVLERWADEEAAAAVGDRRVVAAAVARAALAANGAGPAPTTALRVGGGPVPRRVRALLAPPPGRTPPLLPVALLAAALLAPAASLSDAAGDYRDMVVTARYASNAAATEPTEPLPRTHSPSHLPQGRAELREAEDTDPQHNS